MSYIQQKFLPLIDQSPQPIQQGYATAEMISSPRGFSTLGYDNATGRGNTASLTDGKGRATFSGLLVNETGEGFVCRFVAFNTAGIGVAWTDSEPFDVGVGEPYAIAVSTPVGSMNGGSTFDIPPVISVQVGLTLCILFSSSGSSLDSKSTWPVGSPENTAAVRRR